VFGGFFIHAAKYLQPFSVIHDHWRIEMYRYCKEKIDQSQMQ